MFCPQCNKFYKDGFNYCPEDGAFLKPGFELPKEYSNPFGVWKVTTEGDCEGKSIRNLGVYKGYIDEIALDLAKKCEYSLRFAAIETSEPIKSMRQADKTIISFDFLGFHRNQSDRVEVISKLFKDRPVDIQESPYYGAVTLVRKG